MMLKAIKQKIQKWRLDFENRTYEKKYIKKFG